jgi:hypothetical protein
MAHGFSPWCNQRAIDGRGAAVEDDAVRTIAPSHDIEDWRAAAWIRSADGDVRQNSLDAA